MNFLRYTSYALVLIGALNWGLIGAFDLNLVTTIFGDMTILSKIVYLLVGLSAIYAMFVLPHCEKTDVCKDECYTC